MRPRLVAVVSLTLAVLLAACGGRPATTPPDGGADSSVVIPAPPSDQLDLLFMIDNSNSDFGDGMPPLALSALLAPLAAAHAGLSVQVGIVTSDLGAGVNTPPSCDTVGGDHGALQNTPGDMITCANAHLDDPAARFLSFALAADGSATVPNFVGGVGDAFECYRRVGTGGCGFEHQLGSPRAALAGCNTPAGCTQPANAGFLRPDAYLALIVMTTEDDCTAPPDSTLFDPTQATLGAPLGPLTSYRCFEFGNLCGGADPGRGQGPRQSCVPGNKDPDPKHQLVPIEDLARDFKSLKASPRMVYASVFAGSPTPVAVGLDANGYPDLQPSCTGAMRGAADPGIRLEAFARQFDPDRARFVSVCTSDYNGSLAQIGSDLATALQGD